MKQLLLYTKDHCSLCDVVKAQLETLRPTYPHELVEVDITQDQELYLLYRYVIPVVQVGEKTIKAPITLWQLSEILTDK